MSPKQPPQFGSLFRAQRQSRSLYQAEIASALGVNPRLVSNVEKSTEKTLAVRHLATLQRKLGWSEAELDALRRARVVSLARRALRGEVTPPMLEKLAWTIWQGSLPVHSPRNRRRG